MRYSARIFSSFCHLLALLPVLGGIFAAAAAQAEQPAPGPRVQGAPSVQGVTFNVFNNTTGARTGRLRIDRVDFEYRRRGFMVVAWQPQVVLRGVDLEIGADLAWESQGGQILRALCSHGSRDNLVLRDVRLHLASPEPREIVAARARLTATGALELLEAGLAGSDGSVSSAGTYLLPLTGPQAGQLQIPSPAHSRLSREDALSGHIQN